MARQNQERQKEMEPKRIEFAIKKIEEKGYIVTRITSTEVQFNFKGSDVHFFPYSGWHSGKTINPGRGIETF